MKINNERIVPMGIEEELAVSFADGRGKLAGQAFFNYMAMPTVLDHIVPRAFALGKRMREGLRLYLPNGGVGYIDTNDHYELCSPVCRTPRMLVAASHANRWLLHEVQKQMKKYLGAHVRIFFDNVAHETGKPWHARTTYGCHTNFTTPNSIYSRDFQWANASWSVVSLPLTGSGKPGFDAGRAPCEFQISQRADFLDQIFGGHTTHDRGLFNARSEFADADVSQWRRLHLIDADTHMLQIPLFLKMALRGLLILAFEDEYWDYRLELKDPLSALQQVSRDLSLSSVLLEFSDGEKRTPLEALRAYFQFFAEYHKTASNLHEDFGTALEYFAMILEGLSDAARIGDRSHLFGILDWCTKECLLGRILHKEGESWVSPRGYQLNTLYHELDYNRGLFSQFVWANPHTRVVVSDDEIKKALRPPIGSRSDYVTLLHEKCGSRYTRTSWAHFTLAPSVLADSTRPSIVVSFPDPYVSCSPIQFDYLKKLSLRDFLAVLVKEKIATIRQKTNHED